MRTTSTRARSNLLADIGRSKTEQSRDRIRALTALPKILKGKGPKDLKAHGWSANEIEELFATGRNPARLQVAEETNAPMKPRAILTPG